MTDLSQSEYLRRRYGGHGADRRNLWIVAGLLVAVVVAWLVWQAIALRQPSVAAEGVGFDVVSSSEVTVTFNVTTTPGATVTCTVRALTENLTEVGIKEVTVGPVTEALTTVSTTVATIQPATGASVGDCLIVDS